MKKGLMGSTAIVGRVVAYRRYCKNAIINTYNKKGKGFYLKYPGGRLAVASILFLGLVFHTHQASAGDFFKLLTHLLGDDDKNRSMTPRGPLREPLREPLRGDNGYSRKENSNVGKSNNISDSKVRSAYRNYKSISINDNLSDKNNINNANIIETQDPKDIESAAERKEAAERKAEERKEAAEQREAERKEAAEQREAERKEAAEQREAERKEAVERREAERKEEAERREAAKRPGINWPTATGFERQKQGWYIRPEAEAIFNSGSFNVDGRMGIGAGGWMIAGYRYAPADWAAQTGNVGFELGVGFFTPRLDTAYIGQRLSVDGGLGHKTNMATTTNMVSENFVNGVAQATTRTDVGLTTVSSANGVTVMLTSGVTAATLNQTFSKNAVNNQANSFETATGKTIGASASQVGGFVASGAAVTAVSLGNTTTTITFGQSQADINLNTPVNIPLRVDDNFNNHGDVISGDLTRRILVNSSETVVVNDVREGGSVTVRFINTGLNIPGSTFFAGSLSGTPTLIMNGVPVTQFISSTNTDAVQTSNQTVVRTVAVSATTGFNVSETVSINAQLNKTETAASRNVSETTVVSYNRASAKSARIVVDSKETYIPITIGANYSTPVGKSGFGFTAGLDVGAWVHNISREYYFTGGGGQNFAFTETTVKNYSDNKTIYNYAMGSASVAVSQLATEVKKTFTQQEQAQKTTSGLGAVSLSANVGLDSTASFQYDPNNNSILIAINFNNGNNFGSGDNGPRVREGSDPRLSSLITVNSTASIVISMTQTAIVTSTNTTIVSQVDTINISGTMTSELTTMTVTTTVSNSVVTIVSQTSTTNVSTIVPTIIRLYDSPIATTASQTGILLSTDVIFFGTATPTVTISAGGVTTTAVTNGTWTTGTFVGTVSATSTLGAITLNEGISNLVAGINGVSAVITSTMAVVAGGAITTLLGTAVTIANGSFTTETAVVRTLISSSANVISVVNGVGVADPGTSIKMDQAVQVKGVIIPKVSFNWSPLDNLTFTLGGKLYIVIGGYSDYYSGTARAEAEARGIGYKKDELLWYGGLEFGAQFTF